MPPHDARRLEGALSYVIEERWLDDEFIDVVQRLRAASKSTQHIAEWYGILAELETFVPACSRGTPATGDAGPSGCLSPEERQLQAANEPRQPQEVKRRRCH